MFFYTYYLPRSANKLLPPFFYSALFIGAIGTGKTFKLVELSKIYEKIWYIKIKEDVILKYLDNQLEDKLSKVKEEQEKIKNIIYVLTIIKSFINMMM